MKDNLFLWVAVTLLAISNLMTLSVLKRHDREIKGTLEVVSSLTDLTGKIVDEVVYQAHGGTYDAYKLNLIY